jgi:hypothetical protein
MDSYSRVGGSVSHHAVIQSSAYDYSNVGGGYMLGEARYRPLAVGRPIARCSGILDAYRMGY